MERLPALAPRLPSRALRSELLPRLIRMAGAHPLVPLRVQALIATAGVLPALDRSDVTEEVLPMLQVRACVRVRVRGTWV